MRIAVFDYRITPNNPIGSCHLAMLRALAAEHEFTVFAVEFENPSKATCFLAIFFTPTFAIASTSSTIGQAPALEACVVGCDGSTTSFTRGWKPLPILEPDR